MMQDGYLLFLDLFYLKDLALDYEGEETLLFPEFMNIVAISILLWT